MATLSEIIDNRLEVEAMLYESGGEMTPEIEEMLALSEGALSEKIDGYYSVIQKMAYGTEEIDKEIVRLQALKKTKQNAVKNLKSRLLYYMQEADIKSVDGTLCKAYVKKNAASVKIEDEDSLFQEYSFYFDDLLYKLPPYITLSFGVNKTELKKVLNEGTEVAGCSLESSHSVVFK